METPRPAWTTHGETLKDGMREGNKSKERGGGGLGVCHWGRETPGREQEGTFQNDDEVLYLEGL